MPSRQPDAEQSAENGQIDAAVFDRAHLSQYTGGDRALERELLSLFLGQFAPIRAQLDAAASPQDWKFAAHSLKGSARSIGAPGIAALAETLEAIGYDQPHASKKRVLDALDMAMAAFAGEVEKTSD